MTCTKIKQGEVYGRLTVVDKSGEGFTQWSKLQEMLNDQF